MVFSSTARRGAAVVGALAAAAAFVGMATPGASAATTTYVKIEHLCKAPKPGHAACLALVKVPARAGTPGAVAMAAARPGYSLGPAGGFTPRDLAKAYGVDATLATDQTVAVVDAYNDPNALKDLNTFDAKYGLPAETTTSFKKVAQDGTHRYPAADPGWAGEESLDLDAVRGLCHACRIVLVEAKSTTFGNFAVAENEAVKLGATVISNSYGGAESGAIPASVANAYNHPGIVITASTGDDGMYSWDTINKRGRSANARNIPSSLGTVVAVAGTSLYLNDDGTRSDETVWNENGPGDLVGATLKHAMGASGGGCSTQVAAPAWQRSVAGWSQTTCGKKRLPADVAALADPYTGYDIYDSYRSSGWQTSGGTSLASPLIAAMWALAGGAGAIDYPAQYLYENLADDPSATLNDVTAGGNGACDGVPAGSCKSSFGGSPNKLGLGILDCAFKPRSAMLSAGRRACDAETGYDGASGVGTPKGLGLFQPYGVG